MFRNRNKRNGIVLKYFTVIEWDNRKKYTSLFKVFIKSFNDYLINESIDIIKEFELNYASKKYNLNAFEAKHEIVNAIAQNATNHVSVIYSNNALNLLQKENEKYLINLIIHFKEDISEHLILKVTELVDGIFPITYGYGFNLKRNQEVISESFLKKTWFGVSVKVNNFRIDTSIETGNIPKIYKYNFLNRQQIKHHNIFKYKPLSSHLFYYKADSE